MEKRLTLSGNAKENSDLRSDINYISNIISPKSKRKHRSSASLSLFDDNIHLLSSSVEEDNKIDEIFHGNVKIISPIDLFEEKSSLIKEIFFENDKNRIDGINIMKYEEYSVDDIDDIIHKTPIIKIRFDTPMMISTIKEIKDVRGFSRKSLLNEIKRLYIEIYEEEKKTSYISENITDGKRNKTDGLYKIHTYPISDLKIMSIKIFRDNIAKLIVGV